MWGVYAAEILSYIFCMTEQPTDASQSPPAAQSVAKTLAAQILGRQDLGDRLPSEAELATRFAVSRVTVREALKILAGQGLVSLGRGRRAIVSQPDGAMFGAFLRSLIHSDPRAMFDLMEVRRVLEVQAVTLACRNASRAGLAAVEGALATMRAAAQAMPEDGSDVAAGQLFDRADVTFHQAMALAGGNRVLTFLFEAMEGALLEVFEGSRRGQSRTRQAMLANCDDHAAILDMVRAHDERGAADAMMALIARAETNLRAALGNNPGGHL